MRSKRQRLAVLLLATAVVVGLYYARQWVGPGPGVVCGEPCGKERWEVKTLSDADSRGVNFSPQEATVAWLASQPAPGRLLSDRRLAPLETQVFRVPAILVGLKEEDDGDLHLVIADMNDPSRTMIVEIPSSSCSGACASGHVAEFESARQTVVSRFGPPSPRFQPVSRRVVITGVGFFDFIHGQRGVAPNGVELHPVLSIEFLD